MHPRGINPAASENHSPSFEKAEFNVNLKLDQAVRHHQSGQFSQARQIYERILKADPNHADALHLLGFMAHQQGDNESAAKKISKAINIVPDNPFYYNSLGQVLQDQGMPKKAIVCYEKALVLKSDLAEAHNNMGLILYEQGKLDEALACYQQALMYNPRAPEPHNNMGNIFKYQGRLNKAISSYACALKLRPNYAEACNNMGVAFQLQNRFEEAISELRNAINLRPDYAEAYVNTGITYQSKGALEQALFSYQKAIALDPENANAHFHHSFALLLGGNLEEGWKEYEWRLLRQEWKRAHRYQYHAPSWDGSAFSGKTLFIHAEQGLGDTLQFIRYLPMVKGLGGKVIFETGKPLFNLFRDFPGIDRLVTVSSKGHPVSGYDLYAPLMSIPGLLRTTLETIPQNVPYIYAAPEKAADWQARLGGGIKVGLVWAGKPVVNDNRPCPLKCFLPLFDVHSIRLFGLQKGQAACQLQGLPKGSEMINLGEEFDDFTDTAGAIENLDLVISVDTSVAHLAGAMGKPVWTLLPFAPDWRWLLGREDTPWYPTMRLFRQPEPGNWDAVFQRIVKELRGFVREHPQAGK